ncbi:MAG: alpha amylase C-terminal domain-containing protein, partial [Bacteroidales bacterium]|nr:alpha amylase C-terminal domain-containing protein [Bacteroidales bacterium]
QVISFLLSNCKYWLEEFHFDGFRFDGITSMLYYDHGIGKVFSDYSTYFSGNIDNDAFIYLTMANRVIKECNPSAITIAEDVSGLPGLAAPFRSGGVGFDYRMSMGVADYWIKIIKERRDEDWNMGEIYNELTSKRLDEKTISYAECHDQAMVGDKTIIFRLLDAEMYTSMEREKRSITLDRGIALHKMIRLITASTAGDGYLTFMGNEFGHPEWIDFPREGNEWSYHYARRQWKLAFNKQLKYSELLAFEKELLKLLANESIYTEKPVKVFQHDERQLLAFMRGKTLYAFNFSPINSYPNLRIDLPPGTYKHILDTDMEKFGGFGRIKRGERHISLREGDANFISIYLPARCAIVLKKGR